MVFACAALTGCYHTPDGRSRIGMPLVKDSFESRYQRSPEQVMQAARDVLTHNGTLSLDDRVKNTIEAKVDTRTVTVKVDQVEPGISRIITQARTKARQPDLDLASELDKQIALRLK